MNEVKGFFDRLTNVLKGEFAWRRLHAGLSTKQDLQDMEKRLNMKTSEVKGVVLAAVAKNKEALAEIGNKIDELEKQIATLIENAGDPEVTDEEFLTGLTDLQTSTQALSDIVPGSPETPA